MGPTCIYIYIQNSFIVTSVWTVLTLNSLLIGYMLSFVGFHLCIVQIGFCDTFCHFISNGLGICFRENLHPMDGTKPRIPIIVTLSTLFVGLILSSL